MDSENQLAIRHYELEPNTAPIGIPRNSTGPVDALYFRVSFDRQTHENQFEDLVRIAERDHSGRDWPRIRDALSRVVIAEDRATRNGHVTFCRVVPQVTRDLARQFVYVEQGRSGKANPKKRPLFEQMRRDAAEAQFDRLLVSKISTLGSNVRDVIAVVQELAKIGVSIIPVRSKTGPVDTTTGKLFGTVQAWLEEIECDHRSEAIRAGQARARAGGPLVGRPRVIFDLGAVVSLKDDAHRSWAEIAKELGVSTGSVRRAYQALKSAPAPCQNSATEGL